MFFTLVVYDKTHHYLTTGKTFSDEHMPDKPFSRHFIVRLYVFILHMPGDDVKNCFILCCSDKTVLNRDYTMSSARIKARNDISALIFSNRELCLVSISPGLLHSDDRLDNGIDKRFLETAKPHNIVANLVLLELKLSSVAHVLCLAASAGSRNRASWLDSVLR